MFVHKGGVRMEGKKESLKIERASFPGRNVSARLAMGQNISEPRSPKLHSDLFKKNGKVLFGKKKFTIPPNAERPSATSKPEVFQENEQFVLRWDPPATDNGCPIIGYIIEHLELGLPQVGQKEVDETSQWYSSEPGQVTNTECLLNNLIPGTTYQFRIVAENIIGYSPPSDVSDPIVYNPFGELDDYFCIPRFLTQLDGTYSVMRGEKLTLCVEVEGQPYPIVHWYDKNEMEVVGLKTSFGRKRSLTFNSVDLQHAGKLTVNAENYMGTVSSCTNIVVQAPPHITSNYSDDDRQTPGAGAIFQAGELVRLKFNYSGAPSPDVHLYHNGELVAESDSVSIEKSEDNVVVKIANGTREDRGEYTIHLINDLGEDSASAMLTITDRPSAPVSKPEVLQLSDNSCVLQWRDPEDDGGCPVQNFIVEYFRDGWGVWLKAVTTKGHSTKIRDLIPGSKYKFRVKAENLYGVSEASEESVEIVILNLPSMSRSGDDGLMKTVEEEEAELGEEVEELKPPPIPPRTRESSAEKGSRASPAAPPPPELQVNSVKEEESIPDPPTEKKLFSRREILGVPFNYPLMTPETPSQLRPITPEKSPVDEELEKLKELLNEQSDYSEEELEDEEFTYDFEKLQQEYEEDMMGQQETEPHQRGPQISNQEENNKRLPVFQEITDRWNTLEREMEVAIREFSVTRELEQDSRQLENQESLEDSEFEFPQSLPPPPARFEKSPLRKFEIRTQPEKETETCRQQIQPNDSIPEIRSFVPETSPMRFIDSPDETNKSKSPLAPPTSSPVRIPTPERRSFEPDGKNSPHRNDQLVPSSFEPENSPYRELGRERSPMRSPRRMSPSHSLSPSPPPQRRSSSDRDSSSSSRVLLHDRFTDYLTMKVKDRKIASSLTNIHSQSRSRSTSRPVSPVRSSSSLLDDHAPPTTRHDAKNKSQRRDRTAELQQKYNTVDSRRTRQEEEEPDLPMKSSKSYEYIDEVGEGNNLVVTECSLTVPVTLRPGSRIELWRSDECLDVSDQREDTVKTEQEKEKQAQTAPVKEEIKSRPRDYFKDPNPPAGVKPKQEPTTPQPTAEVRTAEARQETKMPEVKMAEMRQEMKFAEPKTDVRIAESRQELRMPGVRQDTKPGWKKEAVVQEREAEVKKEEEVVKLGEVEEGDEVDEEWLKKIRAKSVNRDRYIRHYEEMLLEKEEQKKVEIEIQTPKVTPEERAERARLARQMRRKTEEREAEEKKEEEEGRGEEMKEGAGGEEDEELVLVPRESLLRRYYPTLLRTLLLMILSPLLLISIPVTLALIALIILSHYLQTK